jgi:hypothetical protein
MKRVLAWLVIVLFGAVAFAGVFLLADIMVALIYGHLR